MAAEMAPGRTQRKTLQQMTHPPTPPLPTRLQRQALATGLSRRLFQCLFTHTLQNKTNCDSATSQFRDCLLTSSSKFRGPGLCVSPPLPLPDPCISPSFPLHRLNICYHHFGYIDTQIIRPVEPSTVMLNTSPAVCVFLRVRTIFYFSTTSFSPSCNLSSLSTISRMVSHEVIYHCPFGTKSK